MNIQVNLRFALIGYKPDCELDKENMAKKSYNLTVGGVSFYYYVYSGDGKSTEFLTTGCDEKLLRPKNESWLEQGTVVQGATSLLEGRSQK